jgi:hypothetical protein
VSGEPPQLRSERTPRLLAAAALAVSGLLAAGLAALWFAVELDDSYAPATSWSSDLFDTCMALAFVGVGLLLTTKRPRNLVGWALSLAGIGLLVGGALDGYARLALLAKPEAGLPGGAAAAALSGGSWTPLMAGVFLLLVTFPGGVPSPRWRPVVKLVLAGSALIWAGISLAPGPLDPPFEAFENPLAPTSGEWSLLAIFPVIAACLLSVAAAAVDLLRRFRRSRGDERQQFKWFAASAALLLLGLPVAAAFNYSALAGVAFAVALIALPVSVGVAVLRYRLYELDRIVSKTLVYGALTVILGAGYAGLVLAGQWASSSFAGGSSLAIAVSTLAVAALVLPLRRRLQRVVDRRFYRRRYDAQRTLEAFGTRLREQVELDALAADLRAVVDETMGSAHVSLWLRRGGAAA